MRLNPEVPRCGQEKIMRHGCGLDLEVVFSHARPMASDSDLLKKFSEAHGISGHEDEVRNLCLLYTSVKEGVHLVHGLDVFGCKRRMRANRVLHVFERLLGKLGAPGIELDGVLEKLVGFVIACLLYTSRWDVCVCLTGSSRGRHRRCGN